MKKATLIIWAIIFGVIALLIFQNQGFFLTNQSLQVNLGVMEAYHTPEMPIAILVLLFFLSGILIAFLFSLSARFKARRIIKKLNTNIGSLNAEVADLRREINSLKGIETPENDTDATQMIASDSNAEARVGQTGTFSIDSKADTPTENLAGKTGEIK
jgi:uncharacterized integral membrane protein